ncbi:MAG TPA: phosphoenolpyruvate--protein phosphotransferase [Planctomycetota bacterium]|nr:phosphoenolpyruvate--protein phosphotransferase [Planctomycetota bacterium]
MAHLRTIHGVAVSPGLGLGPVHVVRAAADEVPTWSVGETDVEREVGRLRQGLAVAGEELQRRQRLVAAQAGDKDAQIFAVHRMILQDPGALKQVEDKIRGERINAEAAVQALIRRLEAALGRMEGDSVRSYAADLADPWRSVLEALLSGERQQMLATGDRVVLASAELTPQVVTFIERERVLALITETGGRFSHGAVLARAFGIPCVVSLPGLLGRLEQGMNVAVDGTRGIVQLQPDPSAIEDFVERRSRLAARRELLAGQAAEPAVTPDGESLSVMVNIESLRDLDTFEPSHTDGIGLLRTEFLYMERPHFPSEDEQFRMYRRALERMGELPVVLRTLDIGGDKRLSYFKTPHETNPALGWRGLRVSLEWQDLFRVQLRAALRSGAGRNLRLLLPMVSTLEDVAAVREIFYGVRASLLQQGHEVEADVPVGVMIEVPSVLFTLRELLAEVDFVSVGTNDLVQYLLAVDRDNPWVAKLYDPQQPSVVRALQQVADAARMAEKPCSVCGDIADDPATALMLLGMGFDAVSVAPNFVAEIKYAVRKTRAADARAAAQEAVRQTTAEGVRRVLARIRERIDGG